MATVLVMEMNDANGNTKECATPSSESSQSIRQENGNGRSEAPTSTATSNRLLAPVEMTALPPPPPVFEATAMSPAAAFGFTTAGGTVCAGGRTYPVVGHCAYGPIVLVERDAKRVEEAEEEPNEGWAHRLYHLNPSPLFGIGTRSTVSSSLSRTSL